MDPQHEPIIGAMSNADGSSRSVAGRSDLRVVTLNLWGRRGSWEKRRRVLVDGLRELQPDLVAFIEAIKTDRYDQVVDLLGDGYHVAHQREREPGGDGDVEAGQGASIASRWPLGEVREIDQHVTPRTKASPQRR